jgi:hypothetical protein
MRKVRKRCLLKEWQMMQFRIATLPFQFIRKNGAPQVIPIFKHFSCCMADMMSGNFLRNGSLFFAK